MVLCRYTLVLWCLLLAGRAKLDVDGMQGVARLVLGRMPAPDCAGLFQGRGLDLAA